MKGALERATTACVKCLCHHRLVREPSSCRNSKGFPDLLPLPAILRPLATGAGEKAANAERHPMSSTAVATEATTANGTGGGAPREALRSANDSTIATAQALAAAPAAAGAGPRCAAAPYAPVKVAPVYHPARKGQAVVSTPAMPSSSAWLPRPIAAKSRTAAASPPTRIAARLRDVPSLSSRSTAATPAQASSPSLSTFSNLNWVSRGRLPDSPPVTTPGGACA
mmetsp:Transcript_14699/g.44388  ORF Transcript_14699/g.44388 Transcript_14699/m.44388 type:complete len:225 (+) Transcript_14699:1312-1986(+)